MERNKQQNNTRQSQDTLCYIVLWYPSVIHDELRNTMFCEYLISAPDSSSPEKIILSIKNENFNISLSLKNGKHESSFGFIYQDSTRSGFYTYSYRINELKDCITKIFDITKSDETVDKIIDFLFNKVYYHLRTLYNHERESFHEGAIHAYYKDNNKYIHSVPDIKTLSSSVLYYYIKQLEHLFESYSITISGQISSFLEVYSSLLDLMDTGKVDDRTLSFYYNLISNTDVLFLKRKEVPSIEEVVTSAQKHTNYRINKNKKMKIENSIKKYVSQSYSTLIKQCNRALTQYQYCKAMLDNVEERINHKIDDYNTSPQKLNKIGSEYDNIFDSVIIDCYRNIKSIRKIRDSIMDIGEVRNNYNMWVIERTFFLTLNNEEANYQNTIISKRSLLIAIVSLVIGLFTILSFFGVDFEKTKKAFFRNKPIIENSSVNPRYNDLQLR